MDCLICLDDPPNKAVIKIDLMPVCNTCFDDVAPNLTTESLEHLEVISK